MSENNAFIVGICVGLWCEMLIMLDSHQFGVLVAGIGLILGIIVVLIDNNEKPKRGGKRR